MVYSKIKKILFILLCIFVLLFPFWCVLGLCSEDEELSFTRVYNLTISPNSNVFSSGSNSVGYLKIEPNYIYTIYLPSNLTNYRYFAISSDIPQVDGLYTYIGSAIGGETFTYRSTSSEYLYLDYGSYNGDITVTRRLASGQDVAVDSLVTNVGIQSLWNTFNDANPFILVVVLFSFGLFIIIALVRKLRKGKGGF